MAGRSRPGVRREPRSPAPDRRVTAGRCRRRLGGGAHGGHSAPRHQTGQHPGHEDGYAKLADFGLAKLAERRRPRRRRTRSGGSRTRPGVIIGTIAYMSPEQASGVPGRAQRHLSRLASCCTNCWPAAGRLPAPPISSSCRPSFMARRSRSVSPSPIALRMAVDKALEKDPPERYQTMRDLVVDLRRALRHNAAETRPAVAIRSRGRWLPWIAVLGLATAIGVERDNATGSYPG